MNLLRVDHENQSDVLKCEEKAITLRAVFSFGSKNVSVNITGLLPSFGNRDVLEEETCQEAAVVQAPLRQRRRSNVGLFQAQLVQRRLQSADQETEKKTHIHLNFSLSLIEF